MNLEKIAAVKLGRYDLRFDEVRKLIALSDGGVTDTAHLAYKYGFMRGRNAEKAARRKAARV